jgi:aerobic-type carbon monoxide dehydrogenase small subunit (CoxS/CutS family)
MGTKRVSLKVNGFPYETEVEPRTLLVYFLREGLGLTGTKVGCDTSSCGACTVLMDGESVKSCTLLAVQADGREVTTIEGLATDGELHPIQRAFQENHGLQCGFCTPGMVMSCAALLDRNPNPKLEDVKHAVSGNLCRCGTYPKVFAATLDVAQQRRQTAGLVTLVTGREA